MLNNHTRAWIQRGALFLVGLLLAKLVTRETPCVDDPPINIITTSNAAGSDQETTAQSFTISPCDCFSETYPEARDKFRKAVDKIPTAKLYSFDVVADDDYTMDIGSIPGSLPGTVVHTSGYHGVEGYAGSAIQVAWLLQTSKVLQQDGNTIPKLPTIILVHAVNPYGMATYRRTNENNVDLNRNGLHQDEWKEALGRDSNIGNYDDFSSTLFTLQRPPTWLDRVGRIYVIAALAILQHGLSTLKRAMVSGQYHLPEGIFYGGNSLQPSLQILYKFLQTHVATKDAVTMINVHTGLGPSGVDTLLTCRNSNISPQLLEETFPESSIPSLTQSATDVDAGYDLAMGTAEDYFARLFDKEDDVIVTQEFGTIPMSLVGIALILENMARHYLPEKEEAIKWAKITTRGAFYKRTPKWRKDVLVRGLQVLQHAIDRTSSVARASD